MSDNKTPDINRRKFLSGVGTAAVGAAALATPRVNLEAAQAKAPRWAMVMDLRRCIGCRACTVACKSENNVSLGRFRAVIQEKTMGTFPNTKKEFLPLMCNHCEGNEKDGVPPCVKICPEYPGKRAKFKTADGKTIRYRTGATYKRPDGMILIDKEKCIGCGKCLDACPYGVRSFDPFVKAGGDQTKQAADKCDLCAHRVDNGIEPSCVNTCQGRARIFGDLNDPNSEVSKLVKAHNLAKADNVLLPEEGTNPHVFYIDPDNMLKTLYTQRKKGKLDHFVDQIP
ncbi:MAG: hydrogenase [gamma proteobacterium symbiont of Ctena orbiculata]|uniref:4Fe-4S dicluster domain-containing protein n=1 Tax=Candidatus Thiodiazotropha taylori TaxID=2792791 RepID=A0A944QVD1_9GAMM|nr:4Fe-4S dicluster domain-containing protein [Candidatus Thiodiazotropha taylori]PUB82485.1 MAG: hydrogenase [gamma proteobacterium symbiont of Ctena orbiculata]MBT2989311.1 4Fe-4S dicluster domain-containing protein [Candidatus Thiodiazotropha taylori]MBT2996891.1 4Fe-4S dicluster domain-containing protein [Candidatus Thiodiazotropha taylori]MBT3000746.1 4Fe-4S dicluster domain-containing protein [Candidatus Thiodiazotropha taylori]